MELAAPEIRPRLDHLLFGGGRRRRGSRPKVYSSFRSIPEKWFLRTHKAPPRTQVDHSGPSDEPMGILSPRGSDIGKGSGSEEA